ncbi:MAG TPA: EamA family transporter [Acidimicrobiia bacterium]|nr:EamA family transporter [Acidimicrobiia bacterium]
MSDPNRPRAIALALLVTVLWSSSWVLIRWGLDDHGLRPLGFAGLRYGLAALVVAAWVLGRPGPRRALSSLNRRQVTTLAGLGVVFYAVTQGAQFVAIDSQPAATTSLLLATTPLVVSTISSRLLGERPTGRQVGGSVLIAGGALAYFAGQLGFTALGLTAALVALASNAASALLGRSVNRGLSLPAEVITLVSMGIGAGLLLVTGAAVEGIPDLDGAGWAIIVWLAVVNTAAAFTWWNWSMRHLTATASTGINSTMLIQIAFLAWIFLGEQPGLIQWVGMVVVSLGVLLSQLSTTRPTTLFAHRSRQIRRD